jgi:hypothetical protein
MVAFTENIIVLHKQPSEEFGGAVSQPIKVVPIQNYGMALACLVRCFRVSLAHWMAQSTIPIADDFSDPLPLFAFSFCDDISDLRVTQKYAFGCRLFKERFEPHRVVVSRRLEIRPQRLTTVQIGVAEFKRHHAWILVAEKDVPERRFVAVLVPKMLDLVEQEPFKGIASSVLAEDRNTPVSPWWNPEADRSVPRGTRLYEAFEV